MKMNKSEISNFGKARKRFDELLGNIDETKSESFIQLINKFGMKLVGLLILVINNGDLK